MTAPRRASRVIESDFLILGVGRCYASHGRASSGTGYPVCFLRSQRQTLATVTPHFVIIGVLFFVALVLFVQTLFVIPKMNVPFSLRQLKGQLRALQRENPAGQVSPASLLWQKFSAARQAAKKLAGPAPTPSPRPRKKAPDNEVRLAFYINGDPYSFARSNNTRPRLPMSARSGWR